jgi:carbamoyl-phosphate synthase large subunit
MARILLTGGGGAGTEALWRLWEGEHTLYFADADADAMPPSLPAERRVPIPMAGDPDFMAEMRATCARLEIDVLVPGVDEELAQLAAVRRAAGWPAILLPQPDFVASMLDKLTSMRVMEAAGLSVPHTVPANEAGAGVRWPCIVKPRSGRGSRGVMTLESVAQLAPYLALHRIDASQAVAQELLEGQEYTVFAFADEEAQLRAVVPVKVLRKRGITIRARTEREPRIVEFVERFQHALRPVGPYNLQCMLRADGSVRPFEVNPRVSTTFCLALAAGADPLRLAAGARGSAPWTPDRDWSLARNWPNHLAVCAS